MCDWSTFDGLDNVLEEPKFEHLEKFEFLLVLRDSAHCTQESIDMKAAEDLLKRVEGRLLSVRNSGKLTTTVRFIKRDDDIMSICVSFKSLILIEHPAHSFDESDTILPVYNIWEQSSPSQSCSRVEYMDLGTIIYAVPRNSRRFQNSCSHHTPCTLFAIPGRPATFLSDPEQSSTQSSLMPTRRAY